MKRKIVFICHFSSQKVRDKLALRKYSLRQHLYKLQGKTPLYDDFAIWVSEYITEFETHPEFEFHIIAPHFGMTRDIQSFENNGIHYHFFRWYYGIIFSNVVNLFKINERNAFKRNRKKIRKLITEINPDIILLCGAENSYYSTSVLDIQDKPIYVILQTLLNDNKRIEMGVGSPYRRTIELEIFKHAHYFCTSGEKNINVIKKVNNNAIILPAGFPTHRPKVEIPEQKDYDFVFFARIVTVNKGIEDLLKAIALIVKTRPKVTLNIIGSCTGDYRKNLDQMISQMGVQNNVHFAGYYETNEDTYKNVAKAKNVVVPGITAGLNSTVRESMLMGLPTICYETPATMNINRVATCLFTAPMNNINELANQMSLVLDNPEEAQKVALRGKKYAEQVFGNEAIVNKLLNNCGKIINKEL